LITAGNLDSTGAPLEISATSQDGWLQVQPSRITLPAALRVSFDPTKLTSGKRSGTITLRYSNGAVADIIAAEVDLPATEAPLIRGVNGVVNGASFLPGIAPGAWISIVGDNLACINAPGRIWRSEEIANNILPTTLENARVTINGRPAAIYFISPTQINAQAPDDTARGTVAVEVQGSMGIARATAELRGLSPGLFSGRAPSGTVFAAAVNENGTYIGRPEWGPGYQPAKPGSVVLLFGTGFGPTQPPRAAGRIVEAAPLASRFTVRIGQRVAEALFGGLAAAGLYQFNVIVPELEDGDHPVLIESEGVSTQPQVVLPVSR
jgi:uncharacterized protein (TIGR03437 family)